MTCTTCQATIADKAIVCYRCGAPTAAPVARVPPRAARRTPLALASFGVAAALGATAAYVPSAGVLDEFALAGGALAAVFGGYVAWRHR